MMSATFLLMKHLRALAEQRAPLSSNRVLAEASGLSEHSIGSRLNMLKEAGYIKVEMDGAGSTLRRRVQIAASGARTDWSLPRKMSTAEAWLAKMIQIPPPADAGRVAELMRGRIFEDHPRAAPPGRLRLAPLPLRSPLRSSLD